jgi:hypothetical protein
MSSLISDNSSDTNVVKLSEKRAPVCYTVHIVHHHDGKLEFYAEDVGDDERSRQSVAWACQQAADAFGDPDREPVRYSK